MKLIHSNGKELTVYDIGPAIMTLKAKTIPLRNNGYQIIEDEKARTILKDYMATGLYDKE